MVLFGDCNNTMLAADGSEEEGENSKLVSNLLILYVMSGSKVLRNTYGTYTFFKPLRDEILQGWRSSSCLFS